MLTRQFMKNIWLTFKQARELGGHVRKGEKASQVVFYKTAFIDEKNRYYSPEKVGAMSEQVWQKLGIKSVPVVKLYHVFNVGQTEGLHESYYEAEPAEPLTDFQKDDWAEALIAASGADIEVVQSSQAYYNRETDRIVLPLREQFRGQAEPFYATALHELGHWTGHPSRLNRIGGQVFGDREYATEELVAELTAAFCCANLGFEKTITSNASYINNWLGVLKSDHRAVVRAAGQAQQAADYIFGRAVLNEV